MKKRITALLLCLVMALSLIPTTVWAADMSWTWTVTVFGGNYCRKDGTESNTNRYTVNRSLDNSVEHEIGYKFQWVKGAGDGTYDGGWQLCLTVDGKVVEESSAYIFSRDMQNASGTWTTPTSSHTGTSSHPFTLSLSSFPKAEPNTPEVPAPDFDKIFGNDTVRVTDRNTTNGHGTKTYSLMDDRYTSVKNSDTKYTIIVKGADYIKDYQNAFPGVTHTTVDDGDKTITLNYKNNTWVPDPSSVTFTVECKAEEQPPTAPTQEEIQKALEGKTFLINDIRDKPYDHGDKIIPIKESDLKDDTFFYEPTVTEFQNKFNITSNPYKNGDGDWVYVLRVDGADKLQSYIEDYNTAKGVEHQYNYHNYTYLKKGADGKWFMSSNYIATIDVKCEQTPAEPEKPNGSDLEKITNAVIVDCTADNTHDTTSAVKGTAGTDYTISGVKNKACTITINNVSAYYPAEHSKDTDQTDKVTVELVYVTDAWTLADNGAAHLYVKCEQTPAKPTDAEMQGILGVRVNCVASKQAPVTHSGMDFRFLAGTYTVSDVARDTNNAWYVTVTVTAPGKYVSSYDGMLGIMTGAAFVHDMYPAKQQPTVKLVYDEQSKSWNAVDAGTETVQYATINVICSPALPTIPELNRLGVDVKVSCATKDSKHTGKTYPLDANKDVVTGTITMNSQGQYECVLKLRDDTAKAYVTDYSGTTNADKKTHTLKDNGSVTLVWGANGWELKDQSAKTLIITATCTTSTTPGGNNIGPAKNPYTKDEPKKVESGKTFDAGIALYVGLGILSLTGSAVAIRKREEY